MRSAGPSDENYRARSVLLVGYGNPLRSDDGLGPEIAARIARLKLPGVETRTAHQLGVELAEEIVRFDLTILVDASQDGPPVRLRPVTGASPHSASSHHLTPECLQALVERIYGVRPRLYACTVRADDFALGAALSPAARQRARRAVRRLAAFLRP